MDAAGLEQDLASRHLAVVRPPGEDWVGPAYQDFSIANLASTVAALFGTDVPGALPALPEPFWQHWIPGLRRVVLVIVDGLGYRRLERRWAAGEANELSVLASAGTFLPLTSVFPSTTNAALTSLHTGVAPATHGWLAWEMYLREMGMAVNGVLLCPIWSRHRDLLLDWGLEPETLVAQPTVAMRLSRAGIQTAALASSHFEGTGFSRMLYRGMAQMWGHSHASDFWAQLREMLGRTAGRQSFISAYWSGVDTIGHSYGPGSEQGRAELRAVSHFLGHEFLEPLRASEREGTLLLITADHGQIRVPADQTVTADKDSELAKHLMVPIVGESRAAFLHPRPGSAAAVREHLERAFPGRFEVVSSSDALASGLMGSPVGNETYPRAGELLALARGRSALQRTTPRGPMIGRHGGLSAEEMLVPLIAARLDAI